jgi:hypothetical protein
VSRPGSWFHHMRKTAYAQAVGNPGGALAHLGSGPLKPVWAAMAAGSPLVSSSAPKAYESTATIGSSYRKVALEVDNGAPIRSTAFTRGSTPPRFVPLPLMAGRS